MFLKTPTSIKNVVLFTQLTFPSPPLFFSLVFLTHNGRNSVCVCGGGGVRARSFFLHFFCKGRLTDDMYWNMIGVNINNKENEEDDDYDLKFNNLI